MARTQAKGLGTDFAAGPWGVRRVRDEAPNAQPRKPVARCGGHAGAWPQGDAAERKGHGVERLRRGAGGGGAGQNPKDLLLLDPVENATWSASLSLESHALIVSRTGNLYATHFFFNLLTAVYLDPKPRASTAASARETQPQEKNRPIGKNRVTYHLIGARWYDPELRIFMSPDRKNQYANPYSYGPGNPILGTDPSGDWWEIAAAVVMIAVAAYVEHEQAKDRAHQAENEAKDRCRTDPGCNPNNIHVDPGPSNTTYGVCVGNECVSPVYVTYNGVDSREAAARGNDLNRLQENQTTAEKKTQEAVNRVYNAVQQQNIRQQMADAWNSTYSRGANRFGVYNETGFRIHAVDGSFEPGPLVKGTEADGVQKITIPNGQNTIGTVHVHPSYYFDSETGRYEHSGFGPSDYDNYLVQPDSRMPIVPGVIIDDRTRSIIIHDQNGKMRVLPPQTYYDILGY